MWGVVVNQTAGMENTGDDDGEGSVGRLSPDIYSPLFDWNFGEEEKRERECRRAQSK